VSTIVAHADPTLLRLLEQAAALVRPGVEGQHVVLVKDLVNKFLDRTRAEKESDTLRDYTAMLSKLVDGFPWKRRSRGSSPRVRLEPFTEGFGDRAVTEVTTIAVQDLRNALVKLHKPKTVNNWLIACKACWNWGAKMKLVGENPFAEFEPLFAPGRERICSVEEFELLMTHSDDVFRPVLQFLRYTPSRPGVVRKIVCSDLDPALTHATLHKTKRSSTSKIKEPWKIPIADVLRPMLRELVAKRDRNGHLFLNEDGRPWTKDALSLRMRRLRERAGIPPDTRGEKIVLYSSRHTYLTKAATSPGMNAALLGAMADHTDPKTTRRYLHFSTADISAAGERVAANLT
jgi:integrase